MSFDKLIGIAEGGVEESAHYLKVIWRFKLTDLIFGWVTLVLTVAGLYSRNWFVLGLAAFGLGFLIWNMRYLNRWSRETQIQKERWEKLAELYRLGNLEMSLGHDPMWVFEKAEELDLS